MSGTFVRLGNTAMGILLLLGWLVALVPTAACGSEKTTSVSRDQPEAKGIRIQPMVAEGLPIALVYVHLEVSTGSVEGDETLKKQIVRTLDVSIGDTFRELIIGMRLSKVQALPTLQSAAYGVYQAVPSGQVVVVIFATPLVGKEGARKRSGMLVTRKGVDFPLLYEDERSKLTLILNGGAGVYCDTNPWFGGHGAAFNARNPLATKPAGNGTLAWGEGYLEPGIGGITRLGDLPLYPYGAVTYILSGTLGDDIYNSGPWGHGELERLYGGFVFDLPGERNGLDLSYGKQIYQIRDGFLLSKIPVSTNAGDRAALYLGPRLASKSTALGRLRLGDLGLDAFMIEPSEIESVETNSRLVGANLRYEIVKGIETAFSFFYLADSDTTFPSPRQGTRTFNPSLSLSDIAGITGLWFKGEYAWQNNENLTMSAHAGYAWLGYQAAQLPWKPVISYRYALFSGEDPNTTAVERFDPLFSGGLGNFLPGIVFSKVCKNSNLRIQRVNINVFPTSTLELDLDYFHLMADSYDNRGGIGPLNTTLPSKTIGDELTLTSSWYFGNYFFLQGIASVGIPGNALRETLGGNVKPWYTLQASLYMFY